MILIIELVPLINKPILGYVSSIQKAPGTIVFIHEMKNQVAYLKEYIEKEGTYLPQPSHQV